MSLFSHRDLSTATTLVSAFGCILLTSGCAEFIGGSVAARSRFKQAQSADTPEAYVQFLASQSLRSKTYTELSRQAASRLAEIFRQSNVRKIKITFLGFTDRSPRYRWTNRATRDGGRVYEEMVKPNVAEFLTRRGYLVTFGAAKSVALPESQAWHQDKYDSRYYLALEPSLKAGSPEDADALLLIVIPLIRYRFIAPDGFTHPYEPGGGDGWWRETSDLAALTLAYHVFDCSSRRRLLANAVSDLRYHRDESPPAYPPAGTVVVRWRWVETGKEFVERLVTELFAGFPEAAQ